MEHICSNKRINLFWHLFKAHTLILSEQCYNWIESGDFGAKLAATSTKSIIVSQQPTLKIYHICLLIQAAENCRWLSTNLTIDSVPQVVEAVCHHSNTQTNKPMKRDGRVAPLIFLLHNADKASADPPIG